MNVVVFNQESRRGAALVYCRPLPHPRKAFWIKPFLEFLEVSEGREKVDRMRPPPEPNVPLTFSQVLAKPRAN